MSDGTRQSGPLPPSSCRFTPLGTDVEASRSPDDSTPLRLQSRAGVPSLRRSLFHGRVEEIVQFTSAVYFCEEDDTNAVIDIMRIGNRDERCSVRFFTSDGSAKSGTKYQAIQQDVVFEPGDVVKSVEVPIVKDDFFDTTLEFGVHLESIDNCLLGKYLSSSRVLIIDNDQFPSNSFKSVIEEGTEEALSVVSLRLLLHYMHFTFCRVPSIWWKSCITAALDQLWNVYYLFTIYLKVYMVDIVLNVANPDTASSLWVPGNRCLTAVFVAVTFFLPQIPLLLIGRLKVGPLEMGKAIRTHLQVNLFRRYLSFTTEAKHKVPIEELTTAMEADIPMMVSDGYGLAFSIMQSCGKISVVGWFMLQRDPKAVLPLVFFPTVMIMFIRSRQQRQVELENNVIAAEASSTGMLVDAVEGFRLIRDYSQRHYISDRYEKLLEQSFKANDAMLNFKFWNKQLVPWLTGICTSVLIALGAQQVILGSVSLGSFFAMIEVYKELGDRFQGVYDDLENWVQAGSPLVQLTMMLNLKTDVSDRLVKNRMRRAYMKEMLDWHNKGLDEAEDTMDETVFHNFFDKLPICLVNMKISYIQALSNVEERILPGTLLYINGGHATGKSTLVRILCDILQLNREQGDEGHCVFSSHNRCLHVSNDPEVLPHLNLYENLTFGLREADPERVRRVCSRLNLCRGWLMPELERNMAETVGKIERQPSSGDTTDPTQPLIQEGTQKRKKRKTAWHLRLSHNERKMVHLARALIFNPEILVLNKPTADADTGDIEMILNILREFVDQRGVELEAAGRELRRPRTAIFSGGEQTDSQKSFEIADVVWHLTDEYGLQVELGGQGHTTHIPPELPSSNFLADFG